MGEYVSTTTQGKFVVGCRPTTPDVIITLDVVRIQHKGYWQLTSDINNKTDDMYVNNNKIIAISYRKIT